MNISSSLNATIIIIPSREITALGSVVTFAFILLGLCGNLLILGLTLSNRKMRSSLINLFIVSLQLNDLVNIGFNCTLVAFAYALRSWPGPFALCELFVYTSIICTGCTLWHHALVSVNQYVFVVHNKKSSNAAMSKPRRNYLLFSLIASRVIPTLVCLPALVNVETTVYSATALRCLLAPNKSQAQSVLILVVNILVPWLIITFCFSGIFLKVVLVLYQISDNKFLKNNLNPLKIYKS